MDRTDIYLRSRKWVIIIFTTILMCINIILAAMSSDIAVRFGKASDQNDINTLRVDIILASAFSEIICSVGVFGAMRANHRIVKCFTLLMAVNTVFSLYISIKAFGLWIVTVINATILYNAAKYERTLRKAGDNNSDVERVRARVENNELSIISDNSLQPVATGEQPPQYEPPPPYSEELTKLPKIC